MEEKTEYKLCPYCKSIYIPTENYCCKHCYEKSFIIRRDVYAQIQSKNKKGSNSIIKLQHDEEFESRKELLSIWKKYGFVGFLHTTNFNNFIDIYKSKFLKSRNQLKNEGLVFEDNAELSVLSHTDELTKSKVRLYYRCKTPTNMSARFWKIKELDGIGSTTYKNLFNYCKKQTTGERYEQLNLFD